jgi:hypothetical protein
VLIADSELNRIRFADAVYTIERGERQRSLTPSGSRDIRTRTGTVAGLHQRRLAGTNALRTEPL